MVKIDEEYIFSGGRRIRPTDDKNCFPIGNKIKIARIIGLIVFGVVLDCLLRVLFM